MDIVYEKVRKDAAPLRVAYDAATFDIPVSAPPWVIDPGEVQKIPTGYRFDLPAGYDMLIRPRSSAFCSGLNVIGHIDNDYTGEVFVVLHNVSSKRVEITNGQYFAQCRLIERVKPRLIEAVVEKVTDRGQKGFGSSGR